MATHLPIKERNACLNHKNSEPDSKPTINEPFRSFEKACHNHFISTSLLALKEPPLKRPIDIFLSILLFVLSLPITLLVACAIKLTDGGPIFYKQERWGKRGSKFWAFKFRTMIADSDVLYGIKQAGENDARITRIGRVLRATGLDELPQIFNIIKGDMSFVGPRALAVREILPDENGKKMNYEQIPEFWERLLARPGLTSISTIYRPKDISARKKFRYDLFYIRRQSLWLDLYLIMISFWICFRGKWETRNNKL